MMQPQTSAEINDIVTAPTVGWWPLATGWWILIALSVIMILIALISWLRYRRRRQIQRLALRQLPDATTWAEVTLKLKQAALGYFPRERIAALSGAEWYKFLLATLPPSSAKEWQDVCQRWYHYPWQADIPPTEFQHYQRFAELWLRKALPPKHGLSKEEL